MTYRVIDDTGQGRLPDIEFKHPERVLAYLKWIDNAPHLHEPLREVRVQELESGNGWPAREFLGLMGVEHRFRASDADGNVLFEGDGEDVLNALVRTPDSVCRVDRINSFGQVTGTIDVVSGPNG